MTIFHFLARYGGAGQRNSWMSFTVASCRGDVRKWYYDFLNPRLTDFYNALVDIVDVTGWIHGYHALTPKLNFAWDEVAVLQQLFPGIEDLGTYRETVREITRESNEILF